MKIRPGLPDKLKKSYYQATETRYGIRPMQHRHLNHESFTLAAIDDIIGRGKRADWCALRHAALSDSAVMDKILRVCRAHCDDPYAQRYHFWKQYAAKHTT